MFKRKLFKRALPVILSVAMIFQSMPATALAAENEMTEVVETTVEDSGSESDAGDEAKEPANEEPEAPAAEQPEASAPAEETKQEEADTPATTTVPEEVSASTEEAGDQSGTNVSTDNENQPETEIPVTEVTPDLRPSTEGEQEEATDEELQEVGNSEAPQEIVNTRIEVPDLEDVLNGLNFKKQNDKTEPTYNIGYDEEDTFDNVIQSVKDKVKIYVNDEVKNELKKDYLTFEWKIAGTDTAMQGLPKETGSYVLHLAVTPVEGVCGIASYDIYFNIEKAQLTLDLQDVNKDVKTGSKISDFKASVIEKSGLKLKDTEYGKTALFEIKAEDIIVYEIGSDGVFKVTEDTSFNSEKKYTFTVKVTLEASIASNYDVDSNNETEKKYYGIEFAGLTETKVKVTLASPSTELSKEYDEKEWTIEDVTKNVSGFEVIIPGNEDEEDALIEDQESAKTLVSPKWYTRERKQSGVDFPELDEETQFDVESGLNAGRYTLMTENPKDAGEYYLVYVYSGENGKYKKGYSEPVKVTIEAGALVLKPTKIVLSEGMDSSAVYEALAEAEYELYKGETKYIDSAKIAGENPERPDFFGVSYSDNDKTQYYGPVFELQTRQKKAPADIKEGASEEEKWSSWTKYDNKSVLTKGTDERPVEYRVRFTGQKAVYEPNGFFDTSVDITDTTTNSAEKNYSVKADEETLNANTLPVELISVTATEIKTDKIIESFTKAGGQGTGEFAAPAWKIYDEDDLFADRASYKLAEITSDIKDTHKDITYTWQRGNMNLYEEYIHTDAALNEGADKRQAEERYLNSFTSVNTKIPKDAGIYRLHIEYKDSSDPIKYKPATKDVYFQIKQQAILTVADVQYANYGDSAEDFKGRGYSVYKLNGNSEKGDKLEWEIPTPDWNALELAKNPDGTNKEDKNENYGPAYEFIEDDANPYVYKAEVRFGNEDNKEYITDTSGDYVLGKYGTRLEWSNYTNINKDSWDAKKGYSWHTEWNDIKFSEGEIEISVDSSKMPQDRVYNGTAIGEDLPEGLVTLKNKTTGEVIAPADLSLNAGEEETAGTVNIKWRWSDSKEYPYLTDRDGAYEKYVTTAQARYGGTYTLYASFTGNDSYRSFEWTKLTDQDENPYTFTIKPLDVIVAPALNEVIAGQPVSEMVDDQQILYRAANEANPIPESDKPFFNDISGERRNAITNKWQEVDGFAILAGQYKVIDDDAYYDCSFNAATYLDNAKVALNDYIRYGKKYIVKFDEKNNPLFAQYAKSYNLIYEPNSDVKIYRGEAEVWSADFLTDTESNEQGMVDLYTERDDKGVYTIVPREGIPFAYKNYYTQLKDVDGNDIPMDKNYIAVDIVSPVEFTYEFKDENKEEFAKQFSYKSGIKEAGGYVLPLPDAGFGYNDTGYNRKGYRYHIKAVFPVNAEVSADGKTITILDPVKEFNITWEEGYTEAFKLDVTNAKLESNLREAVAPKSLAFNGVQTKMAVGEQQQLDVKITKAQLGDVVQINYRLYKEGDKNVTHNEYASIDPETGRLTALATKDKKATAVTVEAYPVRLAPDGKTYEEITGKGVKVAKGKVTVSEVSAPAIKKILMGDTSAEIQFTHVNDGYRREIYVVDAKEDASRKKWKPANFEAEIAKMKNGQWKGIFAIAPVYSYKTNDYNEILKLDVKALETLDAKGSYVVYVRNVSAARTLADGSKVALSTAGAVKAFDTTKIQVEDLCPWFDMENPKNTVEYYVDGDGYVYDDYINERAYTISLFDKTAQLSVKGGFTGKPIDPSLESAEGYWLDLPLKALEKANNVKLTDDYLEPKLSYYVTDCVLENNKWTPREPVIVNKKQTNASVYATVAKNGKITLKGVGKDGEAVVSIWVVADNEVMGECMLQITAKPDKIIAKKVKPLKVGDGIRLADYLEYKNGKNKIPNYWSSLILFSDEEINKAYEAGYELHRVNSDDFDGYKYTYPSVDGALREGEWIITAITANSGKHTLNFTDCKIDSTGVSFVDASIELSSAQMDPVKGLKVAYVDDKHITLNFAYAGHPDAFDIEVSDARGSIVYKKLAWRQEALDNIVPNDAKRPWIQEEQRSIVGNGDQIFKYFEKTKTYAYTITTDRLMRLSAYTISVKPVYNGQSAAKVATTKTKTTNIPASDYNMNKTSSNSYGGITIQVGNDTLHNKPYLTSGNTYTLETLLDDTLDNYLAKTRGTDTLTWKSSNTKVASVKSNPGSFTATLKAVQQGTTVITVTSKVTKKTIARYLIAVKAVGKGASSYGGDYESGGNYFYDDVIATWDPLYEGKLEVLTLSNPVKVDETYLTDKSDRTWVQFTAPTFGEYTFNCNSGYRVFSDRNIGYNYDEDSYSYGTKICKLEANQKIYFLVKGSFTLKVASYTDFSKLTVANTKDMPLKVNTKNDSWITFTAPEDNYYTFESDMSMQAYELNESGNTAHNNKKLERALKAGQTIFIKATKGSKLWVSYMDTSKNETLQVGDTGVTVKFTKENAEDAQYVKFTAPATGDYTFETPRDDVTADYFLLDGTQKHPGDGVVSQNTKTKASKAAEGADGTVAIDEVKLFIEAGETIVIKLTLKGKSFTAEKPEIAVTVKVTSSVARELTAGAAAETVTKDTTATFMFKIPEENGTNQYKLNVTDGNAAWYNNEYSSIYVSSDTLTVKSDKTTNVDGVKAGEVVYIKVEATTPDKDASVSISKVDGTKPLTVGTPINLTLKDGFEDWYTFTVKKTGSYQFGTTVTENAADKGTHTVYAYSCEQVFGSSDGQYSVGNNTTSNIVELEAGQTIVFKVYVTNSCGDDVTTAATFYVNDVTAKVTPLSEGETPVTLNKEGSEAYYSFTGKASESYTIRWADGTDSGAATVLWGEKLSSCSNSLPINNVMGAKTYFIKVSQNTATGVNGTLTVSKKKTELLASGNTAEFSLKSGESAEYKFTVPEKNILGYSVLVENTTALKEGETTRTAIQATIDGTYEGGISDTYYYDASYWTVPYGNAKTIIIRGNGDVTGKITVKPITAEKLDADKADVAVTKAAPVWFYYEVGNADRYVLAGAANTDKIANVEWYKNERKNVASTDYFNKGDIIYVKVSTTATDAQSANVKLPVPITTTEFKLGEDGITGTEEVKFAENQTEAYYVFTAPALASYTFEGYDSIKRYIPIKNKVEGITDKWNNGNTLGEGQKLLIKMTAPGTLKVTKGEMIELKLDTPSKEITLKTGESAQFVFNSYVYGQYDFRTTAAKGLSVDSYDDQIESENRLYFTTWLEKNDQNIFTITNNGSEEAKFTVTAGILEPIQLKLDENVDVTVTKDRISLLKFKVPETGRYTVSCTGEGVTLNDEYKDELLYEDSEGDYTYTLTYNGTSDSQTAKVIVTKLKTEEAFGEEFKTTLEKGEVKWYAYKAAKTGEYSFATEAADVRFDVYKDITSDYYPVNGSMIITENSVVYIRVENNGEKQEAAIKATINTLDELKLGTMPVTCEGNSKYLTFKAAKDGFYRFENDGIDMYYHADKRSSISVSCYGSNDKQFFIMEGETIFLEVWSSGMVTISEGDSISDYTVLNIGAQSDVTVDEGKSQWFTFVAPSDGTYSFYSSDRNGDPKATLYAGGCNSDHNEKYGDVTDDDDGESNNFAITYQLKAGQKVYLEAYAYSDRSARYKVNVMRGRYITPDNEDE